MRSQNSIGVGIGFRRPRPPNRTGGFPAYGSPVGGFFIETVSRFAKPCEVRTTRHSRRRQYHLPPLTPLTSADSRRVVHVSASSRPSVAAAEVSAPCLASLALAGTSFAQTWSSRLHLPTRPSLRWVLLPHPLVVR